MSLLYEFLVRRFSNDELYRLMRDVGGDELTSALPDYRYNPVATFAAAADERLRDRGYIDERLFDLLLAARPRVKPEIAAIAQAEGQSWAASGVVAQVPMAAPVVTSTAPVAAVQAAVAQPNGADLLAKQPIVVDITMSDTEARLDSSLDGREISGATRLGPLAAELKGRITRARSRPDDRALGGALGEALRDVLLQGDLSAAYGQVWGVASSSRTPLHLRLSLTGAWSQAPWELMVLPGGGKVFLGQQKQVWLTRRLATVFAPYRTDLPSQPRVLIAGAEASLGEPIDVEGELTALDAIWRERGVEPFVLRDTSRKRLEEALGDDPWTLLHFVGHGLTGAIMSAASVSITADDLCDLVAGGQVGRIYLSSCLGADPGRKVEGGLDYGWDSLAGRLLAQGCSDVVAFGAILEDGDGLRAAKAWHGALADGLGPVAATAAARYALRRSPALGFGFLQHFTTGS